MPALGSKTDFYDLFPGDLVPDILELVLMSWNKFPKPESTEHEVPITREFCLLLQRQKNSTNLPFKIRWELSLLDTTTNDNMGRADLIFDYLGTQREEVYFLFECKRLCVPFPSGWASLAGEYVGEDGMMCFVTGKYSAGLPAGGMIGYVMDGDVTRAISCVSDAIDDSDGLYQIPGTALEACKLMPKKRSVKVTRHFIIRRTFTIYHIFLKV